MTFDPDEIEEVEIYRTPAAGPTGIATGGNDEQIILIDNGWVENHSVIYRINLTDEDAPKLLPISRKYHFGRLPLFNDYRVNMTMFNVGTLDLVIDSVRLVNGNSGFRLGNIPGDNIILPARYLNIPIYLEPDEYQIFTDTMIVYSNDPQEPEMAIEVLGLGIYNSRHLGFYPRSIDFGFVRADPWRDGNRTVRLALFNMGGDILRIDTVFTNIPDIFHVDPFDMTRLETAESLYVDITFTPHRGITYRDTLEIFSNEQIRLMRVPLLGVGNDSTFSAGTVMWRYELEDGNGAPGSIARIGDVNDDDIDDVVAVGPSGMIYCINGFGSNQVDLIWSLDFYREPYAPTDLVADMGIKNAGDLNSDGFDDVIIGSGDEDRSVYGINGLTGDMLWRWDSRTVDASGGVKKMLIVSDINGDGATDPIVLLHRDDLEGNNRLLRLDGATGRRIWVRNPGTAIDVAALQDFDNDGSIDYAAITTDDRIDIYSGSNGSLMEMMELDSQAPILKVDDIDGNGKNDIVCSNSQNQLICISTESGDIIWNVNEIDGMELTGPLSFLISVDDANGDGISEFVGCDNGRTIFCADPTDGSGLWAQLMNGVTSITTLPDHLNGDGISDILIGLSSARISCVDCVTGTPLWSFNREGFGGVRHMISFADIDLGQSDDLVALFDDHWVRCISSGGDLGIDDERMMHLPQSLRIDGLYPNPFNSDLTVDYSLGKYSQIKLTLYDLSGRLVKFIDLGNKSAGYHSYSMQFDSELHLNSGLYFLKVQSSTEQQIRRALYIK